ncbi:MAG: polysaccharide biosynthesis tyrosine autokinase [Ruminococcus sp.]|uniref:polysaccharide biosynthesis tyrosine autokinase n=1 Tax=Ruminococcus sp. TaxID=41978 RepID=UPI0025F74DE6|nr:polysaccharide biosynthesis tyrosine autokinase [Ruminococcus sp.]MBR5683126.1 polysaccharide biosynthesis tyrosine autokinase [Ruminococcus sp.]
MRKEEIELKEIFALLFSRLWLIITAALIGGAAAFFYAELCMPLKYSSHISMYVQSYSRFDDESEQSYNNISNSKQLINTYINVLDDEAVLNAVGVKLMHSFDHDMLAENFTISDGVIAPASIGSCMTITSSTDTNALKVTATTQNAELSAAVCNTLAKVAPGYIRKAVGAGSINTINSAKIYRTPVSPDVRRYTILGALIGAVLVVTFIIAAYYIDNTIKGTALLSAAYNKPIIGSVQEFELEKKRKGRYLMLTDKKVPFSVVESYKSIRANLSFTLSTCDKKVFTVSSTSPGEGKSTTAANIALALAQGGSKTLLIDGDLRKGVQSRIFGVRNSKGLSSAVSRMAHTDECIFREIEDNLDILPSGPVPPNPSELLASGNMTEMLEKLSERYDTIVIDTPPVNVVTDAIELAKKVSGTIMVVRYGKTTTDDVNEAMKKVGFSGMNMLGFILNGVKTKRRGILYSKYKYGSYGS